MQFRYLVVSIVSAYSKVFFKINQKLAEIITGMNIKNFSDFLPELNASLPAGTGRFFCPALDLRTKKTAALPEAAATIEFMVIQPTIALSVSDCEPLFTLIR